MAKEVEIEAKALLSKEQYESLMESNADKAPFVHVNHYFDTPSLDLRKNHITLRVREREKTFQFTMKTRNKEGRIEWNRFLSLEEYNALLQGFSFPEGDVKDYLTKKGYDIKIIRHLTSLETTRLEFTHEGGILAIDKNRYGGITDYEIECEYTSVKGAKKILKGYLHRFGIEPHFSEKSKSARAMAQVRK